MKPEPPVGLPIWLLALPPIAISVSVFLLVITGWGKSTSVLAPFAMMTGSLAAMLAIMLSFVLVPVGIYTLARNPALRTPPQIGLLSLGALIASFPFLAVLAAGLLHGAG